MKATVLNGVKCGMCDSDLILLANHYVTMGDEHLESLTIKCCCPSCIYGTQEMMRDYTCGSTGKIKVK